MASKRQINSGYMIPSPVEPVRGYTWLMMCIPDDIFYHAAARGALLELTKWTSWEKSYEPGDTRARDAAALFMECFTSTLKIGCFDMLRQNPSNPCEIQIKECGLIPDNWISLIDIGACVTNAVTPILDQATDSLLQQLLDKWDGTTDSIAADLIYDGSVDDDYRNLVQCMALGLIVDALADGELERRVRGYNFTDSVGDLFNTLAGTLLAVGSPYVWIALVGSALINAAKLSINAWKLVQDVIMRNEDYRDEIVCYMYGSMSGSTPTLASFQGSLDGFLGSNGDVDVFANAIRDTLGDFELFLAYLNFLQEVAPIAKAGFLEGSCKCGDWTVTFYSGDGNIPNDAVLFYSTYGAYDAINDWGVGTLRVLPGSTNTLECNYQLESPTPFYLKEIAATIEFNFPVLDPDGDDGVWAIIDNSEVPDVQLAGLVITAPIATATTLQITTGDIRRQVDRVRFGLASRHNDGNQGASIVRWKKLTITGNGYNPFAP